MKHLLTLAWVAAFTSAAAQPPYMPPDPNNDIDNNNYGIWPNVGQLVDEFGNAVPDVSFYTSDALPNAYFRKSGSISLVLATSDTTGGMDTLRRMDVTCVGPHANYPDPVISNLRDHYMNFYLPQCGPSGATHVYAYGRVTYEDMYPHIDMDIYSGASGQKIAWVVKPGGDPKDIELLFEGQDSLGLDVYGDLKILLNGKWVMLPEAVAYQVNANNSTTPVNWTASYVVNNGQATVRFDFDNYDHAKPLVFLVGPPAALGGGVTYDEYGICWSTYFGGANYDYEKDVQGDDQGNVFVCGRTNNWSLNFPSNNGITVYGGGGATEVGTLSKFNSSNILQWTDVIGGNANEGLTDLQDLAVKSGNAIYAAGISSAPDYWTHQETGAYFNGMANNSTNKGCLAKFNASGILQWSTYFGSQNTTIDAMSLGGAGQILISGTTGGNLPAPLAQLAGATVQVYHGGNSDAFIALFNSADQLIWSSYYGGSGDETRAVVSSAASQIVLAGNTTSTNIAVLGSSPAYHQNYKGGGDIFVSHFSAGGALDWASYLGGAGSDSLGPKGAKIFGKDIVLTGICGTLDTLVNGPGWYDSTATNVAGASNGFIARFAYLTYAPTWITYLGSGTHHFPWCLTTNGEQDITIAGYSNDPSFTAQNLPGYFTRDYYDPNYLDTLDGFLARFTSGQQRTWYTLFGGFGGTQTVAENITATGFVAGRFYAVGYTSKPGCCPWAYFPLDDDQQSGDWFNPLFNYNGLIPQYTDGFITQFCDENTVGIKPVAAPIDGFRIATESSGAIVLMGLTDGSHNVEVWDVQGRLIRATNLPSEGGRTTTLKLGTLDEAVYLVRVDQRMTSRFVPVY